MTKILVAKEKHGDRYFDASTNEALAIACIKLLKERLDRNNYWGYEPSKPEEKNLLSEEEIAKLPEEYRRLEINKRVAYEAKLTQYERELEWYNSVVKVVEENDLSITKFRHTFYPKAYNLLCYRNDGEYEQVCIEPLE